MSKKLGVRERLFGWIAARNPKRLRNVAPQAFCSYKASHVVKTAEPVFGDLWKVYSLYCNGCSGAKIGAPHKAHKIPNCVLLKYPMLLKLTKKPKAGQIINAADSD